MELPLYHVPGYLLLAFSLQYLQVSPSINPCKVIHTCKLHSSADSEGWPGDERHSHLANVFWIRNCNQTNNLKVYLPVLKTSWSQAKWKDGKVYHVMYLPSHVTKSSTNQHTHKHKLHYSWWPLDYIQSTHTHTHKAASKPWWPIDFFLSNHYLLTYPSNTHIITSHCELTSKRGPTQERWRYTQTRAHTLSVV